MNLVHKDKFLRNFVPIVMGAVVLFFAGIAPAQQPGALSAVGTDASNAGSAALGGINAGQSQPSAAKVTLDAETKAQKAAAEVAAKQKKADEKAAAAAKDAEVKAQKAAAEVVAKQKKADEKAAAAAKGVETKAQKAAAEAAAKQKKADEKAAAAVKESEIKVQKAAAEAAAKQKRADERAAAKAKEDAANARISAAQNAVDVANDAANVKRTELAKATKDAKSASYAAAKLLKSASDAKDNACVAFDKSSEEVRKAKSFETEAGNKLNAASADVLVAGKNAAADKKPSFWSSDPAERAQKAKSAALISLEEASKKTKAAEDISKRAAILVESATKSENDAKTVADEAAATVKVAEAAQVKFDADTAAQIAQLEEAVKIAKVDAKNAPVRNAEKAQKAPRAEGESHGIVWGNLAVKNFVREIDGENAVEPEGRWHSKQQIEKRFKNVVKEGEPFDYEALLGVLQDVNGLPDLTLDTNIRVRETLEGLDVVKNADIELTAREEGIPLHAKLEVNNYATENLDEWQGVLTLQYLNLTKRDDVLTISPSMTLNGDLWSLAGSYQIPHYWGNGGAFTLYGGYSALESEDVVPRLDLQGAGYFVGLVGSYKLIDNRKHIVSANAGLMWRYLEDQFKVDLGEGRGSQKLQERNTSILPLSLSLSYAERNPLFWGGRNFATFTVMQNLAVSGDNDLSQLWVGAEDSFTVLRLQLARLQPLWGGVDINNNPVRQWTLYARAEAQWSPEPLIPSEKLFIGGYSSVRGYTTKSVYGDTGVYGSIELRTPILLEPVSRMFRAAASDTAALDRWQFFVFMDAAWVSQEDPLPGSKDAGADSDTLLSVGLGLRIGLTSHTQFRIDYGYPLIDIDSDEGNESNSGALYFSASMQF